MRNCSFGGPSTGITSIHQFITRSDFEKNLWPPISIRWPLYFTVREMPPISSLFSRTTGCISVRFRSSYAAVRPAGPAPMIKALRCSKALLLLRRHEIGWQLGAFAEEILLHLL